MTPRELRTEITRLRKLIQKAAERAKTQAVLIDKLTAAQLHIELLMRRLRGGQ